MSNTLDYALTLLNNVPWCENLGQAQDLDGCLILRSSTEARSSFESDEWAGFTLMIRNRNYRDVTRGDYARSMQWDNMAKMAHSDVVAIADRIRARLSKALRPSAVSLRGVDTDVWALLYEIVYADLCLTPVWQRNILPVFQRGGLPCGWRGPAVDEYWAGASEAPLPDGKILVY